MAIETEDGVTTQPDAPKTVTYQCAQGIAE
jgi:hypothetical protein